MKEPLQLLAFEIARQAYALPLEAVLEVIAAVAITPLPDAPPMVEGLIDVRGRIVPVLDIRARFRLPPRAVDPADHMILAHARDRLYALRADRATDLVVLPPGDISSADDVVPGLGLLAGVATTEDGLILIHDLAKFLSSAEAEALGVALEAMTDDHG